MARYKRGDVVRLKSGGPPLTVVEQAEGDLVRAVWFTSAGDFRLTEDGKGIPADLLEPASPAINEL